MRCAFGFGVGGSAHGRARVRTRDSDLERLAGWLARDAGRATLKGGSRRGGLLLARSGSESATSNLAVSAEAHRMRREPIGLYARVWAAGW
jgi:hypothetical protein